MDSIDTLELDASFDEPDDIASSVSWSSYTHYLAKNPKLQLAPRIKSHKLWCLASVVLLPVSLTGGISASTYIHYVSSHPAVSDSRLPLHWITLS